MRIVVAGSTGVLGRATVRDLAGAGHDVVGLVRREGDEAAVAVEGGTPTVGDLLRPETLADPVAGADGVVHVATAIPRTAAPTAEQWAVNDRVRREGTANLVAATLDAAPGAFLVAASVYLVYGNDCGDRIVDEDSPLQPPPVIESAVDAERLVRAAGADQGLRSAILRPGWLYDASSWHTRHLLSEVAGGTAVVLEDAPAWRSPVSAVDAAAAIRLCLEQQPTGATFNVADDEPVRNAALLDGLAGRLGAPVPRRVSRAEVQESYGAGGLAGLTRSVRLSTRRIADALGFRPRHPSWRQGFESVLAGSGK